MQGRNSSAVWRLKVINGCQYNDDLILPVAPQPSLLQSFYSHWRTEDEERHVTNRAGSQRTSLHDDGSISNNNNNNNNNNGKKKGKNKKLKLSTLRRRMITPNDWMQKIPHVALGRHTCLPKPYRLRHACVSRLHCRVVYVGDSATHRQLLSKYPPAKRVRINNNNNNNDHNNNPKEIHVVDRGDDDENNAEEGMKDINNYNSNDSTTFTEPYYRLINCGCNLLYINNESLLCGESRSLCENDIVAFLENPFDEEGGVLEPLRPEDGMKKQKPDGIVDIRERREVIIDRHGRNGKEEVHEPTVRALLFNEVGTTEVMVKSPAEQEQKQPSSSSMLFTLKEEKGGGENNNNNYYYPAFVEVNGVRVARYRPHRVPLEVLQQNETRGVNNFAETHPPSSLLMSSSSLHKKQRHSALTVEHNRLIGENNNNNNNDCFTTPPPKCSTLPNRQENGEEIHMMNKEEREEDDDGVRVDIVGDVVSPLQQRLVSSPRRGGSSRRVSITPEAKGNYYNNNNNNSFCIHAEEPSVIPPSLPVYIFARRSPSPDDFTRQAPSIGRFLPRRDEKEKHEECEREEGEKKKKKMNVTVTSRAEEEKEEKQQLQHDVGNAVKGKKRAFSSTVNDDDENISMIDWVQEEGVDASVTARRMQQSRRGRGNSSRRRRRT